MNIRSKEELRAVLDAAANKAPKKKVIDLSGDEHDHALVVDGEFTKCHRCGAGYRTGHPHVLPKECDAVAHTRRKLGLS